MPSWPQTYLRREIGRHREQAFLQRLALYSQKELTGPHVHRSRRLQICLRAYFESYVVVDFEQNIRAPESCQDAEALCSRQMAVASGLALEYVLFH